MKTIKEAPGTVHTVNPLDQLPTPSNNKPVATLKEEGTKKQVVGHGGQRSNQMGRPLGVKDKLSIADILTNIQRESGMSYAEVLARDFQEARDAGDRGAVTKYHSLILTRVAPSLQNLEIRDSQANMEAKAYAFVEAIKDVIEKEQGDGE